MIIETTNRDWAFKKAVYKLTHRKSKNVVPRSLKYLLSGPSLKTFAEPWPKVKKIIINKRAAEFEAEIHT